MRRRYAEAVARAAGVRDARIVEAFATVPRERHLPPPPWRILNGEGGWLESADPSELYRDALVVLSAEGGINNGEPSLHALAIGEATPVPGEHVVHVGAGGGYYSAILAELVGSGGRVTAFEVEPALVALAEASLAPRANVNVEARSGTGPLPSADLVYVSAGTPVPARSWLDALREKGRLVFPMTPAYGNGAMLMVTRERGAFAARFFAPCRFIPLSDSPEPAAGPRLEAAFARRDWHSVSQLHRGTVPPGAAAWFSWAEGWLSQHPLEQGLDRL